MTVEIKKEWPEETLVLTSVRHEYADVWSYAFLPENPVLFTAGQYGHVRLFGMPEGEKAVREFSFASAPHEPEIVFTVDARSGSAYQKRLQAMKAGDTAGLFKIKSHMTWPPPDVSEAVMIAGGIGVTPFRSMLRDRQAKKLDVAVSVLHVAHADFLYKDELVTLADSYVTVGREDAAARIRAAAEENPEAHFYIAGSPRFVETAHAIIKETGVTRVESDSFKGLDDAL